MLHGNYWLSGAVAHRLKHALDLPLVATFHTLARVKADAGVDDDPEHRTRVEHEVIACADLMLASTDDERAQLASLYDAVPERIEVVPPGVDHSVFFPGDRDAAPSPPRSRRPPRAAVRRPHPAAEGRRPRGPLPRRARRPDARRLSSSAARAAPTATPSWPGCTRSPHELGVAGQRPLRAARSRTTGSPTTTAPPTCASFRRAPSRSGSSRSKPPRAERRSSPPRSAGCVRSSTTATPASSSTAAIPPTYAAPVAKLLGDPDARGRDGRDRVGAIAALLVEHDRRRDCAVSTAISSRAVSCAATDADVDGRDLALDRGVLRRRSTTLIAAHLEGPVAREPWVQTVEYDPEIPRWYVRFGCDGRDAATIYFDLHQRTLRYEVYFLPDPPAHHEELYRFLLPRNHTTYGAHFSIGPDGDVLSRRSRAARAPRRRRARPHHRRALRARRTVVPARDPHRLPPT